MLRVDAATLCMFTSGEAKMPSVSSANSRLAVAMEQPSSMASRWPPKSPPVSAAPALVQPLTGRIGMGYIHIYK